MSVTTLLENQEILSIFQQYMPKNCKHWLYAEDGKEAFITGETPVIDRIEGMQMQHSAHVGTAYDFWLRTFIHKNNPYIKGNPKAADRIFHHGFMGIANSGFIEETELVQVKQHMDAFLHYKNDYIAGKEEIDLETFSTYSLLLAYIEECYRSGKVRKNGYLQVNGLEKKNLIDLMKSTLENKPSLIDESEEQYILNPSFEKTGTLLVGNADADIYKNGDLIEIKTFRNKTYSHSKKAILQLLIYTALCEKYGILSPGEEKLVKEVNRIGIFFARFQRTLWIDMYTVKSEMDWEGFKYSLFFYLRKRLNSQYL